MARTRFYVSGTQSAGAVKGFPGLKQFRQQQAAAGLPELFPTVRASDLRTRMILQQPVETRTPSGGVTVVWQDADDRIWASVNPLRGMQLFYAQQLQSPADTRIIIRYWKGLHAGWRLVDYDNPAAQYVIQAFPRDMGYKHTLLSLECQMLQAGTV